MQPPPTRSTLYVNPDHHLHRVPPGFPERPERITRSIPFLTNAGYTLVESTFQATKPQDPASPNDTSATNATNATNATSSDLARLIAPQVHDPDYLQRLDRAARSGARSIDTPDNPLSTGTAHAAWSSVVTALDAGTHVMAGHGHAFALARPPGHHCEHDRAMGFCYLNQIAILAQALRNRHGLERVAIIDFDVHHGNGTQHLFESRADVHYSSVHQWPFYPGTGNSSETGIGEGLGTTLNIPLPAASTDHDYAEVFDRLLIPAIEQYQPEALLVSAGFDAWLNDPLGGMHVSEDGFRAFGRQLASLAAEQCQGRMVSVLEGGYDLDALPRLISAYLEGVDSVSQNSTL